MNKKKYNKYKKYLKMDKICKDAGISYNNVVSQIRRNDSLKNELDYKLKNQINLTIENLIEVEND